MKNGEVAIHGEPTDDDQSRADPPIAAAADESDLRESCSKTFDAAFQLLNESGSPPLFALITAINELRRPLLLLAAVVPLLDAIVHLLEEGDRIQDDVLVCSIGLDWMHSMNCCRKKAIAGF
jgi:hypothetical protein